MSSAGAFGTHFFFFCRAHQFQVSRAFLLQQAAWLYERELSQVRAQMRRGMGTGAIALPSNNQTPGSGGTSPRPLSPAVGGARMVRTGSGGSYGKCYRCSAAQSYAC